MKLEILTQHPQWKDVKKICTRLYESGFTAWLAGGCVRDGLLGVTPKDFDVATNARPKKVESLFNKTVNVGKAFGVIRVIEPSGDIEVATFRKDGAYIDGRHPTTVELSTPEEDAKRRDFTINAMFYDPFEDKIHDFVGGENDLRAKVIRTVGVASDRFIEDKLRILRAVRFAAQLDFALDPATYAAVCQFTPQITAVSWERISDELSKLLGSSRAEWGVKLLHETGLLHVLFPEIQFSPGSEALFVSKTPPPEKSLLGWVAVISLIPNVEEHDKVLKRLKFSNELTAKIKTILEIVTSLMIFDRLDLADKKRLAAESETDVALDFMKIKGLSSTDLEEFIVAHRRLPGRLIEASDILALGIKPGKLVGELLEGAFDAQLNGQIKNRGEALQWVKERRPK